MELSAIITAFVTIFVVMDPIGLAPVFIALTRGMEKARRRAIALRACTIAFVLLTLFGLFGESVLGFVGISIPAFKIAGGILLFLTALDMLFDRRGPRRKGQSSAADDPSVFPLATPLIGGPGTIATIILLTGQVSGNWVGVATILLVMAACVLIVYAFFLASGGIEKLLGETGINVVTRLLGMLLAALSVQFVIDGVLTVGGMI